jgi:hypothetical protein
VSNISAFSPSSNPAGDMASATLASTQALGENQANMAGGPAAGAALTANQAQVAGQAAQTAQMQNQVMRAKMPIIMHALSDYTNDTSDAEPGGHPTSANSSDKSGLGAGLSPVRGVSPNGNVPGAGTTSASGLAPPPTQGNPVGAAKDAQDEPWWDSDNTDAGARAAYFVPPVTQQDMQRMGAASITGDPQLIANAALQREQRVASQTAVKQQGAQNMFEVMHAVGEGGDNAFAMLQSSAPQTAAKLKARFPDGADENEEAVRYANHVAQNVHQYTGREIETLPDGTRADKITGMSIPNERSTLSVDQATTQALKWSARVDVPDGQGHMVNVPLWQKAGFPSAQAAAMQDLSNQGHPGAQSTVSGVPKADVTDKLDTALAKVGKSQTAATSNTTAAQPIVTAAPGNPSPVDPQMNAAMADKTYRFAGPQTPPNATRSPDEQKVYDETAAARQTLKGDSDNDTKAAASSLTYLKAAKQIMDTQGSDMGALNQAKAQIEKWFPGQMNATTSYQEVAKYLGNAALANARGIYGPRMSQMEVRLQKDELSPSPGMNADAINNMLNNNMRLNQYKLDSARRVGAYNVVGNDPTRFGTWNEQYFPQAKYVNASPAATAATKAPTTYNGLTTGAAPPAPGGAVEGAKSTSKSGKPMMFQNGHWQYQ